jgi:2-polyprenyl-3-methyl-5-hydroxy-6-metoxy-1,4-benzoquinol methylase
LTALRLRKAAPVVHQIVSGKSAAYRKASEALHAAPSWERRATHYRVLWECGYGDLIRSDFYRLFAFPAGASGHLLDAGCGAGIEAVNLQRQAPGLRIQGVDVSSVALAGAVAKSETRNAAFYQAALERLPFLDGVFDYIASHEVIEHVEDPAVVVGELGRVLRPGGVCVIATPNGASLWIDHLRQRAMRFFGRRGAPVGADHTRPPAFWRRQFRRAGFVVERQIFDGAAIEFQLFVAPARWMPRLSRLLEPLRIVPIVNLLLCDRVKFRLRKPGRAAAGSGEIAPCCPVCYAGLAGQGSAILCANGHRFARNALGLVDFSALAPEPAVAAPHNPGGAAPEVPVLPVSAPARRPEWLRRARRSVLLGLSVFYSGFLLALIPLALVVGSFHQPFRQRR